MADNQDLQNLEQEIAQGIARVQQAFQEDPQKFNFLAQHPLLKHVTGLSPTRRGFKPTDVLMLHGGVQSIRPETLVVGDPFGERLQAHKLHQAQARATLPKEAVVGGIARKDPTLIKFDQALNAKNFPAAQQIIDDLPVGPMKQGLTSALKQAQQLIQGPLQTGLKKAPGIFIKPGAAQGLKNLF